MKASIFTPKAICMILMLFCATSSFAQSNAVTGTVTDDMGEPLPAASVAVMNNGKIVRGTNTNLNGYFKVEVFLGEGDNEIQVSYVGSKTRSIKLTTENHGKHFEVVMLPDEELLEEVTIVEDGYARLPRKDMVGAFTTVKADDITSAAAYRLSRNPS